MAITDVNEENFREELERAFEKKDMVILKFGSEYCNSCHALEFELESVEEALKNVSIFLVDTDESPELASQYDVFELPTMVIYNDSQNIIYHKEGVMLAQDINKLIKES